MSGAQWFSYSVHENFVDIKDVDFIASVLTGIDHPATLLLFFFSRPIKIGKIIRWIFHQKLLKSFTSRNFEDDYRCLKKHFVDKIRKGKYIADSLKKDNKKLWRLPVWIWSHRIASQKYSSKDLSFAKKNSNCCNSCQGYFKFSAHTAIWEIIKQFLLNFDRSNFVGSLKFENNKIFEIKQYCHIRIAKL